MPVENAIGTLPVILPTALIDKPVGSFGVVLDQVNGAVPPSSVSCKLYVLPLVAVPSVSVVILMATTFSVKVSVAFGSTPLEAVMVNLCVPVTVGVPASTPVLESVTPLGNVPVLVKCISAGYPVALMVKVLGLPLTKVVDLAEVMVGAPSTVRVKLWVPLGPVPYDAVIVIPKRPVWVGVPESRPVASESHAFGQDSGFPECRSRIPGCGDGKGSGRSLGEGGVIGRGDSGSARDTQSTRSRCNRCIDGNQRVVRRSGAVTDRPIAELALIIATPALEPACRH